MQQGCLDRNRRQPDGNRGRAPQTVRRLHSVREQRLAPTGIRRRLHRPPNIENVITHSSRVSQVPGSPRSPLRAKLALTQSTILRGCRADHRAPVNAPRRASRHQPLRPASLRRSLPAKKDRQCGETAVAGFQFDTLSPAFYSGSGGPRSQFQPAGWSPTRNSGLKMVHPPGFFPQLRAKIRMRNRDQFIGPLANGLPLERCDAIFGRDIVHEGARRGEHAAGRQA